MVAAVTFNACDTEPIWIEGFDLSGIWYLGGSYSSDEYLSFYRSHSGTYRYRVGGEYVYDHFSWRPYDDRTLQIYFSKGTPGPYYLEFGYDYYNEPCIQWGSKRYYHH